MTENINKIIKSILRDIQVEMTDEFDQNFERQAFFSEAWQRRKSPARDEGRAILSLKRFGFRWYSNPSRQRRQSRKSAKVSTR